MKLPSKRTIIVTSALPYANGDIHLGHLVEAVQTDIWARFQRLRGHDVMYFCADDTHGTPITIAAKKKGQRPEDMVAEVGERHRRDFAHYGIEFTHYSSTGSAINKRLSEDIYRKAVAANAIERRSIHQLFCPNDGMFLPDRLIRGTCPKCRAEDQYGDSCEVCSAIYDPSDLIESRCAECGTPPVTKSSEHHFFKLAQFQPIIAQWLESGHVQPQVANKLKEWFETGLKDWDISRDAPYFGFQIPGTTDKYFYVWLDAPIGYIATTAEWAESRQKNGVDLWRDPDVEIHHFIGKDILYFHTLFWPALLHVGGYQLPRNVHVHGFLTVNGEKMSKSRGTFINAAEFIQHFNPEYLRYYLASKLSRSIDDIDFNFEDFGFKVNAEVVNKIVNIASRLGAIVTKHCNGQLSTITGDGIALVSDITAAADRIAAHYDAVDTLKATREIMALADKANQFIDAKAPWTVVKTDVAGAQEICTAGLNALKILAIYLKPIIPSIVGGIEGFLNCAPMQWTDVSIPLEHHQIHPYQHLAHRVDTKIIAEFMTNRSTRIPG